MEGYIDSGKVILIPRWYVMKFTGHWGAKLKIWGILCGLMDNDGQNESSYASSTEYRVRALQF